MADNCVTTIDLKILGATGDERDVEERLAGPLIRGDVTGEELQRWAADASGGLVELTPAEEFLGLLYAGRLLHLKI